MGNYNGKTFRNKTYQPRFIGNKQVDEVTDEIYRILNEINSSKEQFIFTTKDALKELLQRVTQHIHDGTVSSIIGIPVVSVAPAAVAGYAVLYIMDTDPYVVMIKYPDGVTDIFYEHV